MDLAIQELVGLRSGTKEFGEQFVMIILEVMKPKLSVGNLGFPQAMLKCTMEALNTKEMDLYGFI